MANAISDVNVNITVEDVVNPAAFGGICLYSPSTASVDLKYTEVSSYDEAKNVIDKLTITNKAKMIAMVQIAFMQENCPEKIGLLSCATSALENYINCDFRYLVLVNSTIDELKTISKYIESCGGYKVLCADLSSGDEGDTVLYSAYKTAYEDFKSLERTFVCVGVPIVDTENGECNSICTALMAKTNSKPVGSYTYKNMTLKGVYADEGITKTQLDEYHNVNVNAYVHKSGYDVTSEGRTTNGEYLDILDSKDWIISQIKYQLQQCLIINDKISYDNNGISLLESIVVNVLQDAYNNGMIALTDDGSPAYTVNFAMRSETKASDRELRQYVEGKFSFDLAGAIHTVTVNGIINI